MESAVSLLCLQVPTTHPSPEPDQSSLCSPITLPEDPSYYYPPTNAWVFKVFSFPQITWFSPLICYLSLLSLLSVSDQVSHLYQTTGKIIVLYILFFLFFR